MPRQSCHTGRLPAQHLRAREGDGGLGLVRSGQVRSGQIRSDQVRLGQVFLYEAHVGRLDGAIVSGRQRPHAGQFHPSLFTSSSKC